MTEEPDVLVVDDETRLADLFAAWLGTDWTVGTAYDGDEALEAMSDAVEVVLLDRRMPGLSGDEVLEAIRDEGYDCRVVMITAVDPDFDIVGMGFDDYLVKPISKDELLDIVETVHTRSEYEAEVQKYYSLTSKKALLEAEKSDRELEESDQYQDLVAQVEALSTEVDRTVSALSEHEEFVGAFRDLPGDGEMPEAPDGGEDRD
jgi:DNA-binding response OmpR family regulator